MSNPVSGKIRKKYINLSFAELAQKEVKVKVFFHFLIFNAFIITCQRFLVKMISFLTLMHMIYKEIACFYLNVLILSFYLI